MVMTAPTLIPCLPRTLFPVISMESEPLIAPISPSISTSLYICVLRAFLLACFPNFLLALTSSRASMKSLSTCLLHQPSTQPHPSLVQPTDSVVFRSRGSAFSRPTLTGDPSSPTLASLLEERGIKHLVLAGVATSGIVLSTVREAWDKDFAITVLGDGCWDPDEVSCATSLIFMIYEGGFSDRLMG